MSSEVARRPRARCHLTAFLLAAAMLAGSGCKSLIAPPDPADGSGYLAQVLVVDAGGQPIEDASVRIENRDYEPRDDLRGSHGMVTDRSGLAVSEKPVRGLWTLNVERCCGEERRERELGFVRFGPTPVVVDLEATNVEGQVSFPPGFPALRTRNSQIRFYSRVEGPVPFIDVDFDIVVPMDEQGRYSAFLPDAVHDVEVYWEVDAEGTSPMTGQWYESAALAVPGPLVRDFATNYVASDILIGASAAELPHVPLTLVANLLTGTQDRAYVRMTAAFSGPAPVRLWAPAGPVELDIEPRDGLFVVPRRRLLSMPLPPSTFLDVGPVQARVRVEDAEGRPVGGARVDVALASSIFSSVNQETGPEGEVIVLTEEETHSVRIRRAGFLDRREVAEVRADTTLVFVLEEAP